MRLLSIAVVLGVLFGCERDTAGPDDTDTDSVPSGYRWVLIEDSESVSTSSPTGTAGVDIAAVALCPGGGACRWADEVGGCWVENADGQVDPLASDCDQSLGSPGGPMDAGACDLSDPDFVSLGGGGGWLAVSFDTSSDGSSSRNIEAGDIIRVYECGQVQNPVAIDEVYEILVSVDPSYQSLLTVQCGISVAGIAECVVPSLPAVP